MGGETADNVVMSCAGLRIAANDRYTGDFQLGTGKPVLLIGNSWDPVMPLASAYNVSAGFEGSVVLRHNVCGI